MRISTESKCHVYDVYVHQERHYLHAYAHRKNKAIYHYAVRVLLSLHRAFSQLEKDFFESIPVCLGEASGNWFLRGEAQRKEQIKKDERKKKKKKIKTKKKKIKRN